MKLIFKIAKSELRNLFYSPIAWFLTIAFMVQCAIVYFDKLNTLATAQEMGGLSLAHLTMATRYVFTSPSGVFNNIMKNLYLYIPLLTMSLISREINGGTVSLLYSSPVKVREIVFGKYLAMMVYSLILLIVIGIFLTASFFEIKSADYGMLLAAVVGFYLLLCAYSAIGLFMSSLTSYQVIAAISTFLMIGVLTYVGTIWQSVDFVRDLTYFLSLSGRTNNMLGGLITTKDVIYFIVIIYIFLGFTIYKLQSGRETRPWFISGSRYVIIFISALFIGYITSRPGIIGYWDTTANKDNTLRPVTQQIIRELGNDTLEVTAYSNLLDAYCEYGFPENRNEYLALWEPYLRFKPDIKFHFINYYDEPLFMGYNFFDTYKGQTVKQIAQQKAKALGLPMSLFESPEQIKKEINLRPEGNRFVMKLTYKGRSTYLRVFNDPSIWPREAEVAAAFKRLLNSEMPKVDFVVGEQERSIIKKGDREYITLTCAKVFRYALINQGFNIDTVSLNTQNIPDNIKTLVIADPQTELSPVAIQKIHAYIAKGGNLLIAGEPGRQQIVNPLLKTLGVQLSNGMLEEESQDYAPTFVLTSLTKNAIALAKLLGRPSINALPVSMTGVSALSYDKNSGFVIKQLLMTKRGVVHNSLRRNPDLDIAEAKVDNKLQENSTNTGAISSNADTINKINSTKTFTTALSLTRQINGKQQRIIISGDADFLSNLELGRYTPDLSNFYFGTAIFNWLDYGQYPVDTSRPDAKDNRVTVSTDHVGFLKIVYIYVIPGLILIFGAIFLIRRKRK